MSEVECAACGFFLGSGIPGGRKFCDNCACWITTKARQGNGKAVAAGLGLLALGALAGYGLYRMAQNRRR